VLLVEVDVVVVVGVLEQEATNWQKYAWRRGVFSIVSIICAINSSEHILLSIFCKATSRLSLDWIPVQGKFGPLYIIWKLDIQGSLHANGNAIL
jgi:hypothetical protein